MTEFQLYNPVFYSEQDRAWLYLWLELIGCQDISRGPITSFSLNYSNITFEQVVEFGALLYRYKLQASCLYGPKSRDLFSKIKAIDLKFPNPVSFKPTINLLEGNKLEVIFPKPVFGSKLDAVGFEQWTRTLDGLISYKASQELVQLDFFTAQFVPTTALFMEAYFTRYRINLSFRDILTSLAQGKSGKL